MLGWLFSIVSSGFFVGIYSLLLGGGALLYVTSKLTAWLPLVAQYRLLAEILGISAVIIGIYIMGGYHVQSAWQARVTELEAKVQIAEAKSAMVNTVVQEKIVYKTKIVKQAQIQIEERIKEVEKIIDAECKIDPIVIKIINDAAMPVLGVTK